MAQAHGTRYDLDGRSPFVVFDVMVGAERLPFAQVQRIAMQIGLPIPPLLSVGDPLSINEAMSLLSAKGFYGAVDEPEGAVWRVERAGKVDFLAKYVRPDKQDGCYLPEVSKEEPVWNWRPI